MLVISNIERVENEDTMMMIGLCSLGNTKFCISHGKKKGVRAKKQCEMPQCKKDAKSGGLCSKHQPQCKSSLCKRKRSGMHGFCVICKPPNNSKKK